MSDFENFLLLPSCSDLKSRSDVSQIVDITTHVGVSVPIIASCMSSVAEYEMAYAMTRVGAGAIVHRYMPEGEQANILKKLENAEPAAKLMASIGVNEVESRIEALVKANVDVMVLDISNGDMRQAFDLVRYIKGSFPNIDVVSGNIVTVKAAEHYYKVEADAFRVGIGNGGSCTTRVVTGIGRNILKSIHSIRKAIPECKILSDGGTRTSGDIVKSLAAGANAVIVGSLLAVTKESSAEKVEIEGTWYAKYHGMASREAEQRRIERTGEDGREIVHIRVPEGKEVLLPYEHKTVRDVVEELSGGIGHGMAYLGARTIPEMWERAKWERTDGTPVMFC